MSLTVKGSRRSWAVYDGNVRISRHFTFKDYAERDLDRRLQSQRTTERPCMCCGNKFPSEGIHNRLCEACKRNRAPGGDFSVHHMATGYR